MDFFLCSNVAGQWSPVFMQPLPEEEIVIRDDQDPRVSDAEVLYKEMIYPDHQFEKNQLY